MTKKRRRASVRALLLICCLLVSTLGAPQQALAVHKAFTSVYDMQTDPLTCDYTEHFSNTTLEDGRLWTDKSVSTEPVTFRDGEGNELATVGSEQNNFLVSLSALGQSYNVRRVQTPVDAVFVIDLSSSMSAYGMNGDTSAPAGQTRDYLLISALNKAIDAVMSANPENRVAVVGYAGSNTYQLLNLDHYDLSDSDYFTITTSGSTHNVNVNTALAGGAGTTARAAVSGGTPTQLGIAAGARVLTENTTTTYSYMGPGDKEVTIARKPVMLLMTDGDPTYGWLNYTMEGETGASYTAGNGNPGSGDIGTDLTTILTAAYFKDAIRSHYYPQGELSPSIYTLGVGVNGVHAPAVMDPAQNAAANSYTYAGTSYNLKSLLNEFIDPGVIEPQVTFPMNNRGSNTAWNLIDLANTGHQISDYSYTDGYYSAASESALNDAFDSIVQNIVTRGGYVTLPGEDPQYSGYLTLVDPLGEHMEFKECKGMLVGNTIKKGVDFARVISPGPTNPDGSENLYYTNFRKVLATQVGVSEAVAQELLESARASKSIFYYDADNSDHSIFWYADSDMKYVGNYYNTQGKKLAPPEGATCVVERHGMYMDMQNFVSSEPTNLSCTYLTVTTALKADDFVFTDVDMGTHLLKDQQVLRWHLPSALIPLRSVSYEEDPDSASGGKFKVDDTLPIRLMYTVGLKTDFDTAELSADYKARFATPDGTGYYFYTNDWNYGADKTTDDMAQSFFNPNEENPYYYFIEDAKLFIKQGDDYVPATAFDAAQTYYSQEEYFDQNVNQYLAKTYIPVRPEITEITVGDDGAPYVAAGQPKVHPEERHLKDDNVTGTDEWAHTVDAGSRPDITGLAITHYLGNNGRLTVPIVPLEIEKQWAGAKLDEVWAQLYRDGKPYRNAMRLSEANNWKVSFNDLLPFSTTADANGEVTSHTYTVSEGTVAGGTFTPYSAERPLADYDISYTQPVWGDDYDELTSAVIVNTRTGGQPDPGDGESEATGPGSGETTQTPGPGDGSGEVTDPPGAGDGSGQATDPPGPGDGSGETTQTPGPGDGSGETTDTPGAGGGLGLGNSGDGEGDSSIVETATGDTGGGNTSPNKTTNNTGGKIPRTGDQLNSLAYGASVFLIALVVMLSAVRIRRRVRRKAPKSERRYYY